MVDDLFVPSSKRPSVSYCTLTDLKWLLLSLVFYPILGYLVSWYIPVLLDSSCFLSCNSSFFLTDPGIYHIVFFWLHVFVFSSIALSFLLFGFVSNSQFPPIRKGQENCLEEPALFASLYQFLEKVPTYTVIRAPWLLETLEYKYRQSGL